MNTSPESFKAIAQTILDGFDKHYYVFRRFGSEAKFCFEHADWSRAGEGRKERILGYEERVTETVDTLNLHFPEAGDNTQIVARYQGSLHHITAESPAN